MAICLNIGAFNKSSFKSDDRLNEKRNIMMKNYFFLFFVFLVLGGPSNAQLLLEENFDYTAGTLLTENGWINHSGTTNFIQVNPGSLAYPGYLSSNIGNSAKLLNNGEDVDKAWTDSVVTGSVYASFLVNVEAASTGEYFFHFGNKAFSPSYYRARVYVKQAANGNLAFGLSKNIISTVPAVYSDSVYNLNTTYLVVVKYEFVDGADNDIVKLWINPAAAATEPTPTLIHTDVSAGSDIPSIGRIALRQGVIAASATLVIDGIRVSTSWSAIFNSPCPGTPTVLYEGKTYNTVQIGTQCWLKENLDVGVYVASTSTGSTHSDVTNNGTIEKYCYENNEANCATYGGLYDWNEAMAYSTAPGTKGICPTGWHIPTLEEFSTLAGAVSNDGNALKAVGQGIGSGVGTNTSGFSALLAGYRYYDGSFYDLGGTAGFWSSRESGAATVVSLWYYGSSISLSGIPKEGGISIRCLKDESPTSSIQITSPNGGENWQAGSTQNITWTSTNVTNAKLEYTTDSGTNWSTIIASTPASGGSYAWTIPGTPSAECKVRVTDINDSTKFDESDSLFTIFNGPCPGTPTVLYEGKTYNTVQIGTQCWLKENLDVGVYVASTSTGSNHSDVSNNGIIEKYCYGNDTANCTTYGGLYDWNEAMQYVTASGTKGICPTGWHIPTLAEFTTLATAVSSNSNALKAVGQGTGAGEGTNTSGFSALLAGYRYNNGGFYGLGENAGFWSSTEYDATYAYNVYLWNNGSYIYMYGYYKENGFSIRCLKDEGNTSSIQVITPNGGENWQVGSTQNITWTSTNVTNAKLEYTTNSGTNWSTIIASTPASSGSYAWTIPGTPSVECKVRVTDINDSTKFDESDSLFTIFNGPCPGTPTVLYEGKTYNTVQIGTQCWLKENLDIGTMIQGTANPSNNDTIEKYCYNNDSANCETYGGLYQWNEAMQYVTTEKAKGICPTGWHIPTQEEFGTLKAAVGDDGNKLKREDQGTGSGVGTNTSGFSALLVGGRFGNGYFYNLGYNSYFWSSTEVDNSSAYHLTLWNYDSGIPMTTYGKEDGFSLRCLKDEGNTSSIQIISPNGGENWQISSTQNITWSSSGVTNAKLEYTTDSGTNWSTIIASTPASSGSYAWTIPNTPSTQCKVRISDAAADTLFDVSDNNFTISTLITWENSIALKDAGNLSGVLTFGTAPSATDGIDNSLGEYSLPPLPPSGVFDARFELPTTPPVASLKDYRNDTVKTATWVMKFQPGDGGYPFTFTWNPALLTSIGSFFLRDLVTGTIVNINMTTDSSYTLTNSGITSLKIEYKKEICKEVQFNSDWNIVSIPVQRTDMEKASLFTTAVSSAFWFNNGYEIKDTLATGKGYWLKFNTSGSINVCGEKVTPSTVAVTRGWNLIGGYENDIATSSITTTPSGIISSVFYGYNNGYHIPSTLLSGKGYWIKVTQNGVLNLPSTLPKTTATENNFASDWGKIIVTDKGGKTITLYLAAVGNSSLYELPPEPPAGIYDVRFGTDRYVEDLSSVKDIKINGAEYPVIIRVEGKEIRLKDKVGGKVIDQVLKTGEEVVISNPGVNVLSVESIDLPTEYNLAQNYPNPFNPATVIKYSIPEKVNVRINIYNSLGEKIEELVNQVQEAGTYELEWKAVKYSSGVYFYQLITEKYSSVKKMILTK